MKFEKKFLAQKIMYALVMGTMLYAPVAFAEDTSAVIKADTTWTKSTYASNYTQVTVNESITLTLNNDTQETWSIGFSTDGSGAVNITGASGVILGTNVYMPNTLTIASGSSLTTAIGNLSANSSSTGGDSSTEESSESTGGTTGGGGSNPRSTTSDSTASSATESSANNSAANSGTDSAAGGSSTDDASSGSNAITNNGTLYLNDGTEPLSRSVSGEGKVVLNGSNLILSGASINQAVYGGTECTNIMLYTNTSVAQVVGGYSADGNINSKEVNITGVGTLAGKALGSLGNYASVGAYSEKGNVGTLGFGNKVSLGGSYNPGVTANASLAGGISLAGNVDSNEVELSLGTVNGNLVGGMGKGGTVTNNGVTVNGGIVNLGTDTVLAGGTEIAAGDVTKTFSGNTVRIYGGTFVKEEGDTLSIYGAKAGAAAMVSNTVTVMGSSSQVILNGIKEIIGSKTAGAGIAGETSTDYGNSITLMNTTINILADSLIAGGYAGGAGAAKYNKVSLSAAQVNGGSATSKIVGGYSVGGAAENNNVTLDSGSSVVNGEIRGGVGASASNNTVTLDNSGEYMNFPYVTAIGAGKATTGAVSGGTLSVQRALYASDAANFSFGSGAKLYGGMTEGTGEVSGNRVIISEGAIVTAQNSGIIYGGYSGSADSGDVTDNIVNFTSSSGILNTLNGNWTIYGGYSATAGKAWGNTVVLDNTTFQGGNIAIYASGNTEVSGGTITVEANGITNNYTSLTLGGGDVVINGLVKGAVP